MSARDEVLLCNAQLLEAIQANDWAEYERLSDPTVTCIESETQGQIVEGLPFHKFFFDQAPHGDVAAARPVPPEKNTTTASPHVRMIGDSCAVVCYARIVQSTTGISSSQETRVWERGTDRKWRNVHTHRSSKL